MNRNKRTRNSRKGSPLSIDLRDFLMYSNPSRFAPKVKQTGGQAYPQAPTMDQFFSYGAPTPRTPFVFQDGGNMMSFEDPKPNKVNSFLERIKQKGYEALQKEMEDESMMMGDAYDQASMEMDTAMMQWGGGWSGGYETNFDKANQWADASEDQGDIMGAFSNFTQAAQDFGSVGDDYYIKKMKYNYTPTAQYGMELQEFQGDEGESQVNRDAALAQAAYLRSLPARGSGPLPNPFQMFNVPGAAPVTRGNNQSGTKRTIDRNAPIQMPDYYVGENSYAGYVPQPKVAGVRTTGRPGDGSILYDPNKMHGTFNPNWRPFQPIGGTQTTTTKEEEKTPAPRATSKKTQTATQPTAPTNPAAPGTPPATPETPAAGKPEEKPKDAQTPGAGTGPTEPTAPAATENKTPQQVQQEAAQLGMSPQQYMTFLTHADVKMGPLGRRLRKASFDFTTYGPGMNPITASANPQKPFFYDNATGKMEGAAPNQQESGPGDGFLGRLFNRKRNAPASENARDINYTERGPSITDARKMSPQEFKKAQQSQFDPRGYNNAYSEGRNQNFQDRRRNLGQRIDDLYQQEYNLQTGSGFGVQDLTKRQENKRDRLINRYNRIGNRRDAPGASGRDTFSPYERPVLNVNDEEMRYGGYLKHYQDAGPVTFEDEYMPESVIDAVTGKSTSLNTPVSNGIPDYSSMGEKDLASTYVGDIAPVDLVPNTTQMMGEKGKGKLDVKFGKKQNPYTKQFISAGLDLLSTGLQNREASRNEKMFRNKMGADQVFTPMQDMSRGDYTANEGYFRPDQQVPTQFTGYNFESPYARMGGSYKKGGEYYLTQDEIDEIIAMGGQIEFLD
jgi:hypothetical protein